MKNQAKQTTIETDQQQIQILEVIGHLHSYVGENKWKDREFHQRTEAYK